MRVHVLCVGGWVRVCIRVCDFNLLSQTGSLPDQFPSSSQLLIGVPLRVKPVLHSYLAIEPTDVPSKKITLPFSGD